MGCNSVEFLTWSQFDVLSELHWSIGDIFVAAIVEELCFFSNMDMLSLEIQSILVMLAYSQAHDLFLGCHVSR